MYSCVHMSLLFSVPHSLCSFCPSSLLSSLPPFCSGFPFSHLCAILVIMLLYYISIDLCLNPYISFISPLFPPCLSSLFFPPFPIISSFLPIFHGSGLPAFRPSFFFPSSIVSGLLSFGPVFLSFVLHPSHCLFLLPSSTLTPFFPPCDDTHTEDLSLTFPQPFTFFFLISPISPSLPRSLTVYLNL